MFSLVVKLPQILKVLHLLDQALSSILSRWSNHCSLLSCKHSLVLLNFSLVLHSSAEILISSLLLHNHITIFASFLSILVTSSSLTGQVSVLNRIYLLLIRANLVWLTKELNIWIYIIHPDPYDNFVKIVKLFHNFKRLVI